MSKPAEADKNRPSFYQMLRSARPTFLYSLSGAAIPRAAMMVLLIVLPRYVDLSSYGIFVLVVTANEVIEMSATNWSRLLLYRRIIRDRPAAESSHAAFVRGYASNPYVRIAAGTTLVAVLLASSVGVVLSPDHSLIFGLAIAAAVLATAANRIVLFVLQGLQQQVEIGRIEAVRGLTLLPFCLLAAASFSAHIFSALMFSFALSTFASLCFSWRAIAASNRNLQLVKNRSLELRELAVPLGIGQAANFAFGWIDRFLVGLFLGPLSAGLYTLASSLGRPAIEVAMGAMNAQTSPILMAHDATPPGTDGERAQGALLALTVIAAGGAAGVMSVCSPIAGCLMPRYDHATVAFSLPAIVAGTALLSMKTFFYDNLLNAIGRNWLQLHVTVASSVLSLSLSGAATYVFGIIGAAVAFAASGLVASIAAAVATRRALGTAFFDRRVLAVAGCAIVAGSVAFGATRLLSPEHACSNLSIGVACYLLSYSALLALVVRVSPGRFLSEPWNAVPRSPRRSPDPP